MSTATLIERCIAKWREYASDDPEFTGADLQPIFDAYSAQNTALLHELCRKVLPSYVAAQWYFDELEQRLSN